ncbi:MAG TPA: nickel-binding protein [Jatrophihabitans sp.]|nr:nickel-binding protein [Jatrophihabitans sp.]
MALFVVERYAPAVTNQDFARADQQAAAARADGTSAIRHIRTWFLPADETCFALFEAPSEAALRAAGNAAGLRFTRITEAIETSGGSAP